MKKIINLRLALFLSVSLIVGIVCCYNKMLGNSNVCWWIVGVFFALVLCYLFIGKWKLALLKRLMFCLTFIAMFIVGAFCLNSQVSSFNNANLNNHYFNVSGKVKEIKPTDYGVYLVVDEVYLEGYVNGSQDFDMGVYVSCNDNLFRVGHEINFYSLLKDRELFYEQGLSVYDIAKNVKWVASVDYKDVTIGSYSPNLFQKLNTFIKDSLFSGLDSEQASVASALLLGQDEQIPEDVLSSFRMAGVAHIFAVSGLHIGFLATLLAFVFRKIKLNKWIAMFLTACILIFYSGVCGFSSSSLRATIMCLVMLFSYNVGYRYDGLTSIAISAIIILLISPIELFCAGFQLSFVVVLGILLLSPTLNKVFRFIPYKLRSSLSAVVSAQLVSIPVCIMVFGKTSLIAVLCNLVFIPLVGFIYVLTFLSAILGGIFGIPTIALFISNYIFKAVIFVMEFFDYSSFMVGGISLGIYTAFYYLSLLFISGFFNLNKILKFTLSILTCIAFIVCAIVDNHRIKNRTEICIIGSPNACFTLIDTPNEDVLVVHHIKTFSSVSRLQRLLDRRGITHLEAVIMGNSYGMTDGHTLVGRVKHLVSFNNFYYFGEINEQMERAIKLSFGNNMDVANYLEDKRLPLKTIDCKFYNNGHAIYCQVNGTKTLTFSAFNSNPNYSDIDVKPDIVVAYDYEEMIFSQYNATSKISFCGSAGYKNAYLNGNLIIPIK